MVLLKASNWVRNSLQQSVKFCVSVAVGNSQSILKPSNKPGAVMPAAMLPLMNMSMQEAARAWRPAAVLAAVTKAAVLVADAPPSDISTFRLG